MDELCRMCGKPRNEHYGAIESCFGPMDERNGHYAPRCASCAALRADNARILMESAARADERVAMRLEAERLRADNAKREQYLEAINSLMWSTWGIVGRKFGHEEGERIMEILERWAEGKSSQAPEAKGAPHSKSEQRRVTIQQEAKGESGEAELLVPCALLDALNKALEGTFWTSDDGTATRGGTPEDDDMPDYVAKPWRNLRALLARKPAEEQKT